MIRVFIFILKTHLFSTIFTNSSKKRKEYLVLTCGPPSMSTATPTAKGEDGNSCSDDESSGDEENQTVGYINILIF